MVFRDKIPDFIVNFPEYKGKKKKKESRNRARIHNGIHYKVHISVCTIPVTGKKISQTVRSYKGCLEIPTVVNLTTESASVRASTVDHGRNTMC